MSGKSVTSKKVWISAIFAVILVPAVIPLSEPHGRQELLYRGSPHNNTGDDTILCRIRKLQAGSQGACYDSGDVRHSSGVKDSFHNAAGIQACRCDNNDNRDGVRTFSRIPYRGYGRFCQQFRFRTGRGLHGRCSPSA